MLWQSENTVVVGKHQNALAEINYPFVRENNIKVARRISGGGTVFHDAGNVNFAFIKNVSSSAEISFKIFTQPVVTALAKMGIEATTSGRNDLLIGDLKISGNAEHIFKNRVLHHGTLLFNTDLENLGQAIKVEPGKFRDKAVQSNRSKVTNISGYLEKQMSVEEFVRFLIDVQLEDASNSIFELKENDIQNIQQLSTEKFKTWEWNFGYSPKYSFINSLTIDKQELEIKLEVVKGIIDSCNLSGSFLAKETSKKLEKELAGKQHRFEVIQSALEKFMGSVPHKLINAFF
jgi:lipoate-protein ligase A